jgi:hypothetical protein
MIKVIPYYHPLIPPGDVYCQEIYLKNKRAKFTKEDTVLKEFSRQVFETVVQVGMIYDQFYG